MMAINSSSRLETREQVEQEPQGLELNLVVASRESRQEGEAVEEALFRSELTSHLVTHTWIELWILGTKSFFTTLVFIA